jgi:hypothetical protein
MTPAGPLAFVETHGVVLESARGPVPTLAHHVAPLLDRTRLAAVREIHTSSGKHEVADAEDALGDWVVREMACTVFRDA